MEADLPNTHLLGAQNDMISWLWNASPKEQRTVRDIAIRIIYLAVAATHNSSSVRNMGTDILLCLFILTRHSVSAINARPSQPCDL
jgi:hypothetical protein